MSKFKGAILMFDLYYIVLFTEEDGLVGTHSIFVNEDDDLEKELLKNINTYRKSFRSTKEKLFMFNKKREQVTDVTDKFKHLFEGNEKDNQIKKWIEDTLDKLWRVGQVKIENGYFQSAFIQHVHKVDDKLEQYSYELHEDYTVFTYKHKSIIMLGDEEYEPNEENTYETR